MKHKQIRSPPETLDFVAFWRCDFVPQAKCDGGIAFEEFFLPRVRNDLGLIQQEFPFVTPRAIAKLATEAVQQLSDVCAAPILQLFLQRKQESSCTYCEFVQALTEEQLFEEFPELELVSRMLHASWLQSLRELLVRWRNDIDQLRQQLGVEIIEISELGTGLSDRHAGGRTVCCVTSACGQRVIYKPRNIGSEASYNSLLSWIRSRGFEVPLRTLRTLDQVDYGWVEHAGDGDCTKPVQLNSISWSEQAGCLAALWWLLDASDLHMGNIFMHAGNPILVDAETFFQTLSYSQLQEPSDRSRVGIHQLGFFPNRTRSGRHFVDYSGLTGKTQQATSFRVPVWSGVGTDDIRMSYSTAILVSSPNSLASQNRSLDVSAIESGFRRMVAFIQSCENAFFNDEGPIGELSGQQVRSLTRSTRLYYMALNASLRPESLRCSSERQACVEAALGDGASCEEIESILALDLPRKVASREANGAMCDRSEVHLHEVRARWANMNDDLDRLCSEIRLAIAEGILHRSE